MALADWLKKSISRDRFAELLLARLRDVGLTDPVEYDPQLFRLLIGGGEKQAFLDNHFAELNDAPPWRRPLVLERIVGTILAVPVHQARDFLAARKELLPVVRDPWVLEAPRLLAELEGAAPWRITSRAIADDYCLALVLDSETAMSFVSDDDLAEWGVPFDRALEYARDNLAARSIPPRFERLRPGLFVSAWHDNYDASRLLFPEVLRALPIAGRPVVAMPSRDLLIVTGDEDPQGWLALAELVTAEVQKPRPLGAVPLVLVGDVWRTFRPTGSSSAEVAVRNLITQARGWTYADQKRLLERTHERLGSRVFVASYSGLTPSEGRETVAFATWTRGVSTLLPRTTELALVDPELPEHYRLLGLYPWEKVEELAGALMIPAGLRPERWRVEQFPDERALTLLAPHRRT